MSDSVEHYNDENHIAYTEINAYIAPYRLKLLDIVESRRQDTQGSEYFMQNGHYQVFDRRDTSGKIEFLVPEVLYMLPGQHMWFSAAAMASASAFAPRLPPRGIYSLKRGSMVITLDCLEHTQTYDFEMTRDTMYVCRQKSDGAITEEETIPVGNSVSLYAKMPTALVRVDVTAGTNGAFWEAKKAT
jgi:hypothetical protein